MKPFCKLWNSLKWKRLEPAASPYWLEELLEKEARVEVQDSTTPGLWDHHPEDGGGRS